MSFESTNYTNPNPDLWHATEKKNCDSVSLFLSFHFTRLDVHNFSNKWTEPVYKKRKKWSYSKSAKLEWQYSSASALTLSGPLLSNSMFTMAHWLVLKLLYISSLTTFKIPLRFVHSVTLVRRFMRAILKSNKLSEGGGGQAGQVFNLFYQIWLYLSFVVWHGLHGYKQEKTVASFNSLWLQRGKTQMHSVVVLKMKWSNG